MTQFPQAAGQEETPPGKQSYHSPELRDYGTIRELTLSGSTNPSHPSDNIVTFNGVQASDGISTYLT